jgi:predicted nucleotidyltransferase
MRSIDDSSGKALDFINRRYPMAATVFLTGSSVDGYGKEGSDIDLVVLTNSVDLCVLESFEEGPLKFDVFQLSRQHIREVLEEEGYNARSALLSMVVKGIILKDEDGVARGVVELAKFHLERGYQLPDLFAVQQTENRIRRKLESLDDGKDLLLNIFLLNDAVESITDMLFLYHFQWLSTGKVKARQLKAIDPCLYEGLTGAYRSMLSGGPVADARELLENKLRSIGVRGSLARPGGGSGDERLVLAVSGKTDYFRLAVFLSEWIGERGGFAIYYMYPHRPSGNMVHIVFRDLRVAEYEKLAAFLSSSALSSSADLRLRFYPVNANASFLVIHGGIARERAEALFGIFNRAFLSLLRSGRLDRSNAFQYAIIITKTWLSCGGQTGDGESGGQTGGGPVALTYGEPVALTSYLLNSWRLKSANPYEAADHRNMEPRDEDQLISYRDHFDKHAGYYKELFRHIAGSQGFSGPQGFFGTEEVWRKELAGEIRDWSARFPEKESGGIPMMEKAVLSGSLPEENHFFSRKYIEMCLAMLEIPERDWGYLAYVLERSYKPDKSNKSESDWCDHTNNMDAYEKLPAL